MNKHRILELYSGIGGMHYAWEATGFEGKIVAAIDINTVANEVYKSNFNDTKLLNRNIQSVSPDFINSLQPNVVLMSPPCQPYTRNGLQKDTKDLRSDSFIYILNILKDLKTVQYLLLENVKGFETSNAHTVFIDTLNSCGFVRKEFLLSPMQFGVPNSRLRYYCLARRKDNPFPSTENSNQILYELPGWVQKDCWKLDDMFYQDNTSSSDNSFDLPEKFLKRANVLDICYPESKKSCCFTKAYTHYLEGTGSVFTSISPQKVKETFENCQKLDPNSDEYKNQIKNLNIRFFTPKEVSKLMSFPDHFSFPKNTTKKQCYRLLGNSINVKVVSELIKYNIL